MIEPHSAAPDDIAGLRALPFGFQAPFLVTTDENDIVYLEDAKGEIVETFNTHTQLPLNRQDWLDEDREEWKAWAETIAGALNGSATLSARIEALEAMLRETLDKGLTYWEPQTARGAVAKADMKARIAALLSSEADHG